MLEQLLAAQIANHEREVASLTIQNAAQAIANSERLALRLETNERRIIRSLSRLARIEA